MRRDSFFGQVLTAVTRSTPATNPVRDLTTDTRTARPASQLLTAIARNTPAFTPGSNPTLETRLKTSRQARSATSMPHTATGAGSREDVIEIGHRIPSARQRGSYRQALVVALAAFAVPTIIASAVILKAALQPRTGLKPPPAGGRSHSASPTVSPTASPSALRAALILANQSAGAKGLLPPSTCKQQSTTLVTCTAPAPGIDRAAFQTYPNLKALYAAYTTKVQSLNSGKFQANFQDCSVQQTYGEVGWNHMFQHPKAYSVAQQSSGALTNNQTSGRVFCTFTNGQEDFVWTQDDGHLMAYVVGPVHQDVWNWWLSVHHNIGFGGGSTGSTRPAVRFQGVIAIDQNGIDLDALPPATGGGSSTFSEDAGGRLISTSGTYAEWTGMSTPSYSQCHNLVLTQGGVSQLQLTSGLKVCVLTGSGRTAYVKVMDQSATGWDAQVIVWNQ